MVGMKYGLVLLLAVTAIPGLSAAETIHVRDYTPRRAGAALPVERELLQAEVLPGLGTHSRFLTRPTGTELQFVITKRVAAAPLQQVPGAPSQKK